jgi:hypothetical protein
MEKRRFHRQVSQGESETNKIRRYIHSPFSIEHNENVKASCDKDGKVTITVLEPGKEEYDEVIVPASLIFRLESMLRDTRKVRWVPREEQEKEE